ncbi:MAG: ABC transporter substrate-binding protein [Clostridiales bacterium]|jgi:peptide/nickel transport system substrate-binding protein|nr:ABC transporter substrate-binding protein [Clostridiales bacterium]
MIKKIILLTLICAFALSACGGGEPEQTVPPDVRAMRTVTPPSASAQPVSGGDLTLSMRHPLTLNPLLNEDETVDRVLSLIFEKLFILDAELRPVHNPALLTGSAVSADGKTWTLDVRQDARWQDGSAITAEDVRFSIEYLKNTSPMDAVYKECAQNILSAQVSGGSVRVNLIQPYAQMGYMLRFPIIPSGYYRNAGEASDKQMNPVGSGPYKLDGRDMLQISLTASEQPTGGAAYIQNIKVIITASDEDDVNAFIQGVTDAAPVTSSGWSAARAASQNFYETEYVSGYFDFIGFNFQNPAVAKRETRLAVAHALPYADILQTVYKNAAVLAPTPISPASWLHDEMVAHYEYNTQAASDYLRAAELAGTELRVLVNSENAERVRTAELLARNLAMIGAAVDLRSLPWDEYVQALQNGDFDIFLGGYKLQTAPDLGFMLHSESEANYQRYQNANMDGFLAEAHAASEEAAILHAYSQLQNYIAYEMPIIGLVFRKSALLTEPAVQGPVDVRLDDVFYNIEEWYLQ